MARTMKAVDAVMVGMGWSGSIMARELTKAGLTVVGLERGAPKSPQEDFALPRIRDELKYRVRQELMLDTSIETYTLRNNPGELALPMRKWDIPPVGDGLGGAGAHWNGVTWRFIPSEFVLRSHLTERYGRNAIPADMTIQDWGIARAPLRAFRAAVRHLWQGRKPARPEDRSSCSPPASASLTTRRRARGSSARTIATRPPQAC
jgi:gluconate 2-dehydrogenase alpha chain